VPSFNCTITTNTTPAIINTLSGVTTYQQFKNSLGNIVYFINRVYLYSLNLRQIQGSFLYSKYDSDGKQNLQNVISAISPYQYQNSIYLSLKEKNLIIDGRDYVRFKMQPNTQLAIKLYVEKIANGDVLDYYSDNNFKALEDSSGKYNFFDEYTEWV